MQCPIVLSLHKVSSSWDFLWIYLEVIIISPLSCCFAKMYIACSFNLSISIKSFHCLIIIVPPLWTPSSFSISFQWRGAQHSTHGRCQLHLQLCREGALFICSAAEHLKLDSPPVLPPFIATLPKAKEKQVSVLECCQTGGKFLWMCYTMISPKNWYYTPQGVCAAYFWEGTDNIILNMD